MELSPKQQIAELVKTNKKILILTHLNPDGDALGSILALGLVLTNLGKEVTAVCPSPIPESFKFLPSSGILKQSFDGSKDFVISVDCSQTQVERLGYKNNPNEKKLNIVITPKKGTFSPEDLSFSYGIAKYDLIFVLDSSDLERLSSLYEDNSEIFYDTPVINIDHHPGNDYFGKVNWIDLTATSTAEILVSFLESLGREKSLLNEDIATCLLTGIITDTGSFQNQNTTPKSFTVSAQLVAAGARQQEIIQNVFKTRKLSTLKLWGRILNQIQHEPNQRFIWSKVSKADLDIFEANEEDTSGVVDELLKTVPQIDFALLLAERSGGVHGSLRGVGPGVSVAEIAKIFGGGGHELAAAFHIPNTTLLDVENEIISKLKDLQEKKISLNSGGQFKTYPDQTPIVTQELNDSQNTYRSSST